MTDLNPPQATGFLIPVVRRLRSVSNGFSRTVSVYNHRPPNNCNSARTEPLGANVVVVNTCVSQEATPLLVAVERHQED